MPHSLVLWFGRLGVMTLGMLMLGVAVPAAHAAEQPVQLSLKPVGQDGGYFQLTLRPGQSRTVQVELSNVGESAVEARTYPADVYTIVNGGFGARLHGATPTGSTQWLHYETQVLQLAPGHPVRRRVTVSVPAATAPGQYVTSVVLENSKPVEGSGSVALNQVIRQALAISIRVPGPLQPALAIHAAHHQLLADQSVVAVDVANPGNARLAPSGTMSIRDESGHLVHRSPIAMGSFYAHTSTRVEAPLPQQLPPGHYTVDLTLTNTEPAVRAVATELPLTIETPESDSGLAGAGKRIKNLLPDFYSGLPTYALALAALAVFGVIALVAFALWRRRGRGHRATHSRRRAVRSE